MTRSPKRGSVPTILLILTLLLTAACGGSPATTGATSAATAPVAAQADPTATGAAAPAGECATEPPAGTAPAEVEADPEATPGEPEAEADPEPGEETPAAEPDPVATGGSTGTEEDGELLVYSGRSEELIGPIIEDFERESGADVAVRYGETPELAATILEEGANSPADVYISQDAGALGALAEADLLGALPQEILDRVDPRFRSAQGEWVGISGRARVLAYDTRALDEDDLPESVLGLTDAKFRGQVGWAPTNASFQTFVTALRLTEGDDAARQWLEQMRANGARTFDGNDTILQAVASGEIQAGLVNHYYLYAALREAGGKLCVRNYAFPGGDPGSLVNVAGGGVLATSDQEAQARELLEFLLSAEAQEYFSEETFEYPLVQEVEADSRLTPLAEIEQPELDLSRLREIERTQELLQETGVI